MRSTTLIVSIVVVGLLASSAVGVAGEPQAGRSSPRNSELAKVQAEHARLKESAELTRKDYELLIETLLKSKDEAMIMMGLRHMHKCQSYGFHPYSVSIHNELIKLTYSANQEIREASVLSIMRVAPTHAIAHGFQGPGSPWQAVREDPESERTRRKLDEEIAVKGTFTPQQLATELDKFDVDVRFHPDLEQKPLEVNAVGVTLRTVLTRILEPRGWNYWIDGKHLLVASSTYQRSRPTHVYNVRGILSDTMTLSRVAELCEGVVSEDQQDVSIEPVGPHKISVKASEFQHHRIATYLGTIAPELKSEF